MVLLFQPNRIFNTWMGDPSKIVFLETLIDVIREDELLPKVKAVGKHFFKGMRQLQVSEYRAGN